jgi:hypothetical protein
LSADAVPAKIRYFDGTPPVNPLAVRSSIVIGFVQGLIGGGGSVLGVPALIYVVGVKDPHLAIGTGALAVAISVYCGTVLRQPTALIQAAKDSSPTFALATRS